MAETEAVGLHRARVAAGDQGGSSCVTRMVSCLPASWTTLVAAERLRLRAGLQHATLRPRIEGERVMAGPVVVRKRRMRMAAGDCQYHRGYSMRDRCVRDWWMSGRLPAGCVMVVTAPNLRAIPADRRNVQRTQGRRGLGADACWRQGRQGGMLGLRARQSCRGYALYWHCGSIRWS